MSDTRQTTAACDCDWDGVSDDCSCDYREQNAALLAALEALWQTGPVDGDYFSATAWSKARAAIRAARGEAS